ncbi:hypothetical protein DY000_02022002 [Brassica cretica]|uniref:Growth-regulating factor n=1 Tax=Brassica cretica TaxID=69181 RepID=A0ABQ7E8J3_BRACR|nr:hypothetical protein DY000_02022002 [Brassica cretica]
MPVLLKNGQSASREKAVEEMMDCRSMKQHWPARLAVDISSCRNHHGRSRTASLRHLRHYEPRDRIEQHISSEAAVLCFADQKLSSSIEEDEPSKVDRFAVSGKRETKLRPRDQIEHSVFFTSNAFKLSIHPWPSSAHLHLWSLLF